MTGHPDRKQFLFKPSPYSDTKTWQMSPALLRSRQPYFWKNMATGALLFGFVYGVYSYTIYALRPDDFSDIPVPPIDEESLKKLRKESGNNK